MEKQPDTQLEAMFEMANRDPALKRRLLKNPREVAKEWNVELNDQEVEQLTKLGGVVDLADDIRYGQLYVRCDPRVCYPVTVWKVRELVDIIRYLVPGGGIFYPREIFYPGPEGGWRRTAGRSFRVNPDWIRYPGPEGGWGGGFGGWGGGWGGPGPIFYPASLRRIENYLIESLRSRAQTRG